MSETATPNDLPTPESPETESVEAPEKDWQAEAAKWKELSRKNEMQAKANAEKAQRLDEIEESNKSELQKLQDQLATTQSELDGYKQREDHAKLVKEVAADHELDADYLPLLTEQTREGLERQIEVIKKSGIGKPTAPDESVQGNRGESIAGSTNQLTEIDLKTMTPREIRQARKEGRLDDLLGVNK